MPRNGPRVYSVALPPRKAMAACGRKPRVAERIPGGRPVRGVSRFPPTLARALRQRLAAGYTAGHLRADVMAGLVVGIIAPPLATALAIEGRILTHVAHTGGL